MRIMICPPVGLVEAHDHPPDGRFATAALPNQAEDLPAWDSEADAVHRFDVAVHRGEETFGDREVFFQVADFEQGRAVTGVRSPLVVSVDHPEQLLWKGHERPVLPLAICCSPLLSTR